MEIHFNTFESVRKKLSVFQILLYCLIAIGVLCALYQYCYNRSIWLDEASLALNILDRSFAGLLQPLDHYQVAPIGFLMVEKAFTSILGINEFALRLFPLLCFLASIPLFYILSQQLLRNHTVALLCTSIFSTMQAFIYYASELKQYSSDVLITVILIILATRQRKPSVKELVLYSIIGMLAIWFSNISIFILFISGVYLLFTEVWKKQRYRLLVPPIIWVVSFCAYYVLFIHNHPLSGVMTRYWDDYFLPLNPLTRDFYRFIVYGARDIYADLLGFGVLFWIPLLVSAIGLATSIRRKEYVLVYFCLAPVCLHLLLSGFSLYPFSGRLVLYLVPLCIVFYSVGLEASFRAIQKQIVSLPSWMLAIPAIVMLVPLALHYPREREEIKKPLMYIHQFIKPQEKVYVYYGAQNAFRFYQKSGFTKLNKEVIYGGKHRFQRFLYDPEMRELNGRIWMLFAHVYPFNKEYTEENYLLDLLIRNGGRILEKKEFTGSSYYYIDTGIPANSQ